LPNSIANCQFAIENRSPIQSAIDCQLKISSCLRLSGPRGVALRARTHITQKLPGVNTQFVPIVPTEFDGVLANRLRRFWLGCGLEHRQRSGRQLGRVTGPASCLAALIVAHGAGAGIPQKGKAVGRPVTVLPLYLHTRAGSQIHFNRLGICGGGHKFSIAQPSKRRRTGTSQGIGTKGGPGESRYFVAVSEQFGQSAIIVRRRSRG